LVEGFAGGIRFTNVLGVLVQGRATGRHRARGDLQGDIQRQHGHHN